MHDFAISRAGRTARISGSRINAKIFLVGNRSRRTKPRQVFKRRQAPIRVETHTSGSCGGAVTENLVIALKLFETSTHQIIGTSWSATALKAAR